MSGEYFNSAAVIGPNGEIMGVYRKNSIPLISHSSSVGLEKFYFRPGNLGFPVFATPFGVNVGILICYDRQFPEGARALALGGADVILIPVTTVGLSRRTWDTTLKGHAAMNLCYVGAVNRVGKDIGGSPEQFYYGSATIVDPQGQIMTQAGDKTEELVCADIDLNLLTELRTTLGYFRDRRPDAYGILVK